MYDQAMIDRFIQLRGSGWTYSKIEMELRVSRPVLIEWAHKNQVLISGLRTSHLEDLRDRWLSAKDVRVDALGTELRKVEAELAKRDLAKVATGRLYGLADRLRRRIADEIGFDDPKLDR